MQNNVYASSILIALGFAGMPPAEAATYRWVDADGRVQYGDSVPAAQVRRGYAIYDEQGRQIGAVAPAKSADEIAAAQREAALAAEQARRDRVLLQTFTSEDDLKYARDQRLATVDSALAIEQEKLDELQRRLADLEAQAEGYLAQQASLPEELVREQDDARAKIGEVEANIAARRAERQAIEDGFAADLARYRELRAGR